MNEIISAALLIFAGLIGGFLNAMVSSGSAVTLPMLIFLGIPPSLANATNRLPVVVGFLSSTYNFHKAQLIDWKKTFMLSIPILIGTVIGVFLVEQLSDMAVNYILIIALLFSLALAITKFKKITIKKADTVVAMSWISYLLFLIIGIWGGLIVLDTATFILFALTLTLGMDLIKANAMKSALCLIFTFISLLCFEIDSLVDWEAGIMISIGSLIGGYIGSKLAISENSRVWLFRLLVSVICFEILSMICHGIMNL